MVVVVVVVVLAVSGGEDDIGGWIVLIGLGVFAFEIVSRNIRFPHNQKLP